MSAVPPKKLSVYEIKSRLLNIAQTSLYQLQIVPPPDLSKFVASAGRNVNTLETINLLCSEASLPGSSFATHDITNDYHGVAEKMAYRRLYDDSIDLTFYVDRDYSVIEFFDGWMNYIAGEGTRLPRAAYKNPYINYRMQYPDKYRSTLYLTKFEKDHYSKESRIPKETMKYTFVSAFPTNLISMPVSYEASNLLKCTVSFSYIRYVRERSIANSTINVPNTNAPGIPELTKPQPNPTSDTIPVKPIPFDTTKLETSRRGDVPVYYNNGIDGSGFNQRQGPGRRDLDATNFTRDFA